MTTHPDYIRAVPSLERHAAEMRDMVPHYRTLQGLAHGCRYVVEFGVRTGVSTWALLEALPPDGLLLSWDIEEPPVPDQVRDDPRWRFHKGDSLTATVEQVPGLVFIDTSHTYRQTMDELRLCASWGAPLIVLHDWNLPGVADAVTEFCDRTGYYIDGVQQSQWGMVWVRKP